MNKKNNLKQTINNANPDSFFIFVYQNRWLFMLSGLILFLVYGGELNQLDYRLDNSYALINPYSDLGWTNIGRFGAVFIKYLLGFLETFKLQTFFNPYFSMTVFYLFFVLSLIVFCYLIAYCGINKVQYVALFFLIYLCHPIWTEQYMFTIQVDVIAIGNVLVTLSVLFCFRSFLERKRGLTFLALLLGLWAFSIYQSYIILWIAESIVSYWVYFYSNYNRTKLFNNTYYGFIVHIICCFFCMTIVYFIFLKFVFPMNGYLVSQSQWNLYSFKENIKNILIYLIQLGFPKNLVVTFGRMYIPSLILFLFALIYDIYQKKFNKKIPNNFFISYVIVLLCFQLLAFIFVISGANIPAVRARLVFAFVTGFNFYYALLIYYNIKNLRILVLFLSIVVLSGQIASVQHLQYSRQFEMEQVNIYSMQVINSIKSICQDENPHIVFVGNKVMPWNSAAIRGSDATNSVIMDAQWYILYLNARGFSCSMASENQIREGRKIAQTMPIYPREGSIKCVDDYIIVKLTEDNLYNDEVLVPNNVLIDLESTATINDNIKYGIESITLNEGIYSISGWGYDCTKKTDYGDVHLYLYELKSKKYYKVETGIQCRKDLNAEIDTTLAGFIGKVSNESLVLNPEQYKLVIGIKSKGQMFLADTGHTLADIN